MKTNTFNYALTTIISILKSSVFSIDAIVDHKNLEYFSTTTMLIHRQVW